MEAIISNGRLQLAGDLTVPANARGFVIFAHGSGSSKDSARNLNVARTLRGAGLATLLFDLLTSAEAVDRENVFDIPRLAGRLILASHSQLYGIRQNVFRDSFGDRC